MIAPVHVLSLENLGEAAARALLMAGCVGLTLSLLRVRNVAAQKTAWTLVLAGAIAMPFVHPWAKAHVDTLPGLLQLNAARWMPLTAAIRSQSQVSQQEPATQAISDSPTQGTPDFLETHADLAPQTTPSTPTPRPAWPQVAVLLYGSAATLLVVRVLYGLITALRLWFTAEPFACETFPALRIRTSRRIASPVTIASGVLLPAAAARWDNQKLCIVLAHESSHVRQGDFYIQLCAELYTAVFWFSPLGWWLRHKLYALNETLSDGAAVREAASHASYAQMLLEFAALPRTTIGVAMARPASISVRIERLLDESRFRQAFAACPLRKLIGGLLVPVVLCAAAALLQVSAHAAMQEPAAPPPPQLAPTPASPAAPSTDVKTPEPAVPAQNSAGAQALPPSAPPAPPSVTPSPEEQPAPVPPDVAVPPQDPQPATSTQSYGSYTHERDGEFYGLFERHGGNPHFSGSWTNGHADTIEKAEKLAHGDFLLYTDRNGKSYYIDDPEIVMPIEVQERVLRDFYSHGDQFARAQEAMKRAQSQLAARKAAPIDKAELQRELADLNGLLANLHPDNIQSLPPSRIQELQSKLGELQGKLATLQGNASFNEANRKLAEKMEELAKQQAQSGWQNGERSRDAEIKMKSAIEEALKSGKAKPVE